MKRFRNYFLAMVVIVIGLLFFMQFKSSGPAPVLVFKGYERSTTNADQYAKFELQNISRNSIWLRLEGKTHTPQILQRPEPPPTDPILDQGISVTYGRPLRPGESFDLRFPLVRGERDVHVGINYYLGNYKDDGDFIDNTALMAELGDNFSLKERMEYYWERARRKMRSPKRCEVWCKQMVSFQEATNNPNQPNLSEQIR